MGTVTGQQTSWTLSSAVRLPITPSSGWQLERFTLIPGGSASDYQIYNFYVDPYSK